MTYVQSIEPIMVCIKRRESVSTARDKNDIHPVVSNSARFNVVTPKGERVLA